MTSCGPACTVPSCASSPVVGFGSAGLGVGSRALGIGGLAYGGLGYGGLGYGSLGYGGLGYGSLGGGAGLGLGYGSGALVGGSTSSGELGTLAGVVPQPINQIPASEVVIQPPASIVTIPGPILSASCTSKLVGWPSSCPGPESARPFSAGRSAQRERAAEGSIHGRGLSLDPEEPHGG
ncbi:hypothetical protein lerEdw1_015944 [Lerista edwardsae]|nr:hypothetical protein lerEdw1_015944 [Lerista edwardsae]